VEVLDNDAPAEKADAKKAEKPAAKEEEADAAEEPEPEEASHYCVIA
jgi:hypothetical protein